MMIPFRGTRCPLDGLRQEVCPECGRAFDPHDAETFVRVLPDPVRVQRLPIAQAHAVAAMLESRGVPARVMSEVGGVIGYAEVPQGSIWVDRIDEGTARSLMDALSADALRHDDQPWTCAACGETVEAQFDSCWSCGGDRS